MTIENRVMWLHGGAYKLASDNGAVLFTALACDKVVATVPPPLAHCRYIDAPSVMRSKLSSALARVKATACRGS